MNANAAVERSFVGAPPADQIRAKTLTYVRGEIGADSMATMVDPAAGAELLLELRRTRDTARRLGGDYAKAILRDAG